MLNDLSGILDSKNYFLRNERTILNLLNYYFFSFFFLFHEYPSDVNYNTEKKGRVATVKTDQSS